MFTVDKNIISFPFLKEINLQNQQQLFHTIVNATEIINDSFPSFLTSFVNLKIVKLQANFYLPSLRKNPLPDDSNFDLLSDSAQAAAYVSHKEKYNPLTGHAIELTFYFDFGDGNGWQRVARDYFYNLGLTEQYLTLISPYFSLDESFGIGQNQKIGFGVSSGAFGPEDYIIIHGTVEATVSGVVAPDTSRLRQTHGRLELRDSWATMPSRNRQNLLLVNDGPGKMFFNFDDSGTFNDFNYDYLQSSFLLPGTTLFLDGSSSSVGAVKPQFFPGLVPSGILRLASDTNCIGSIFESYLV